MNIAVVCELYPPYIGGHQVRIQKFLDEFVRNGVSVSVFTIDHLGSLPDHESINGVAVHRVTHDARYYKTGRFGRRTPTLFRYAFDLLKPLRQQKFDCVIFTQFSLIPAIFCRWYALGSAVRVLDFVEWRSSRLWNWLNRLILVAPDKIICNTESNRQKVSALLGPSHAVSCVFSPVDTSQLKDTGDHYFVYIGRMEPHKHPETAIQVVLEYNRKFAATERIIMVGDGQLFSSLKIQYQSEQVNFTGYIDDEKKREILSGAKVLIVPSEREGLPEVVIEALASGVPTLTTDYLDNGTKDFVRTENIGEVASPNIVNLVDSLKKLVDHLEDYKNRCVSQRDRFNIPTAAQHYLSLLKR